MKHFAEKLKSLLSKKKENGLQPTTSAFDFVKTRKGILKELVISKQSNNIIGIYCKALGDGMFLTAVEDIEAGSKNETIVFHRYDVSGQILTRNRIQLEEIQMVCSFNRVYQKPVFSRQTK